MVWKGRQDQRRVVITIFGLFLLILGGLASLPANKSHISFYDPQDPTMDPDFDIISMSASLEGRYCRAEMTVAGVIQYSGRYVIDIVADMGRVRHIYQLEVSDGAEEFYGAQVFESGSTLTVMFPLDRLLPGAVIIGLEGVAWDAGLNPDYAHETDRDALHVSTLLPLPFPSYVLLIPGACLAVVGAVAWFKIRKPSGQI